MLRVIIALLAGSAAWTAEMPDEATKAIAAFEKKRHDIEGRTSGDLAKEIEALTKTLQKLQERETKAHHADAARAIAAMIEELAATSTTVTTRGNKPFAEFLRTVSVTSQSYQGHDIPCGSAAISVTPVSMDCKRGLNVMAIVDGQPRFKNTYHERKEFAQMITDIATLPSGAYVVMAVQYDVVADFPDGWIECLRSLGAKDGLTKTGSYLLIGGKGIPDGAAVEMSATAAITYPVVNK